MDALSELGRRWLLIATVAVAAAGATAAFSFTAAKRYRATAVLVVQPVPPAAPAFLGLDVLHDTARRSAAATAARLVRAPEVAEAVRVRLGLHGTAQTLLDKVSSHVVGGSDAVDVTATDTNPARAAQIANGFVDAFVTQRSAGFQSELQSELRRLRLRLAAIPRRGRGGAQTAQLTAAIAQLQRWVGFADPTVRHGSEAVQPRDAAWPHPFLWTLYGGLAGLVAGCLAALALGLAAAVHRRKVVGTAAYDRPMPERAGERAVERAAERLETRLTGRVEALAAEQARLEAREAALAARERDLEAKLEELRAATAAAPAAGTDAAERRRAELDERRQALERREQELAARERLVEAGEQERREAAAPPPPPPQPPDQVPPAPETPVAERETAPTAPPPAPQPLQPAPARSNGGWLLDELEQLVEQYADEYPDHTDEWRSYLYYLRDYADASGRVPPHFDWLVEDTFGELLLRR